MEYSGVLTRFPLYLFGPKKPKRMPFQSLTQQPRTVFKGISANSKSLFLLEKGRDEANKKAVFRDALVNN